MDLMKTSDVMENGASPTTESLPTSTHNSSTSTATTTDQHQSSAASALTQSCYSQATDSSTANRGDTGSARTVSIEDRLRRLRQVEAAKQKERVDAMLQAEQQAEANRRRIQEERKKKLDEVKQRGQARRELVLQRKEEADQAARARFVELSSKRSVSATRRPNTTGSTSSANSSTSLQHHRTASAAPANNARNPGRAMTSSCLTVAFGSSAPRVTVASERSTSSYDFAKSQRQPASARARTAVGKGLSNRSNSTLSFQNDATTITANSRHPTPPASVRSPPVKTTRADKEKHTQSRPRPGTLSARMTRSALIPTAATAASKPTVPASKTNKRPSQQKQSIKKASAPPGPADTDKLIAANLERRRASTPLSIDENGVDDPTDAVTDLGACNREPTVIGDGDELANDPTGDVKTASDDDRQLFPDNEIVDDAPGKTVVVHQQPGIIDNEIGESTTAIFNDKQNANGKPPSLADELASSFASPANDNGFDEKTCLADELVQAATPSSPNPVASEKPSDEPSRHQSSKSSLKSSLPLKAETAGAGEGAVLGGNEAAIYKAKLVEQRRLAKERREEEQRRLEEENRQRRLRQEQARLAAEQAAAEAEQQAALEAELLARQREAEEEARKQVVAAERAEKLAQAELERSQRRLKLDSIMSRVKPLPTSSTMSMSQTAMATPPPSTMSMSQTSAMPQQLGGDETVSTTSTINGNGIDSGEEEVMSDRRWSLGPALINDNDDDSLAVVDSTSNVVANENNLSTSNSLNNISSTAEHAIEDNQPPPVISSSSNGSPEKNGHSTNGIDVNQMAASTTSLSSSSAPRFKSALLQSMLGGGRLATSAKDAVAERSKTGSYSQLYNLNGASSSTVASTEER